MIIFMLKKSENLVPEIHNQRYYMHPLYSKESEKSNHSSQSISNLNVLIQCQ